MDDLRNVLDSLVHMAASENDGKSAVVVRIWSDGTCDLEHYVNGEEVGEYGVRKRRTRMVDGVRVERIIGGINALHGEEWMEGRVQAPQDARRQIRDLERKLAVESGLVREYRDGYSKLASELKQIRDDARFLMSLVPTWPRQTEEGLEPTFYGTCSEEMDWEINEKFQEIRERLEDKDV